MSHDDGGRRTELTWTRIVRSGRAFGRAWRGDELVDLSDAEQEEARRRVLTGLLEARARAEELADEIDRLTRWLMSRDLAGWRKGVSDRRRDRHSP